MNALNIDIGKQWGNLSLSVLLWALQLVFAFLFSQALDLCIFLVGLFSFCYHNEVPQMSNVYREKKSI